MGNICKQTYASSRIHVHLYRFFDFKTFKHYKEKLHNGLYHRGLIPPQYVKQLQTMYRDVFHSKII